MKSVFPVTAPNSMAPTQLCMGPDWITRLWSSMTSSITPALVPSVIISTAAQRRNQLRRPTDYTAISIYTCIICVVVVIRAAEFWLTVAVAMPGSDNGVTLIKLLNCILLALLINWWVHQFASHRNHHLIVPMHLAWYIGLHYIRTCDTTRQFNVGLKADRVRLLVYSKTTRKPSYRWQTRATRKHAKIAQIRRVYNVVADNTGLYWVNAGYMGMQVIWVCAWIRVCIRVLGWPFYF